MRVRGTLRSKNEIMSEMSERAGGRIKREGLTGRGALRVTDPGRLRECCVRAVLVWIEEARVESSP